MIEQWRIAVRDHPDRPPPDQCHVLMMLPMRLGWSTGQGFASVAALCADSGRSERTVRRALQWATSAGLLVRVQRGHRRGDGSARASVWKLLMPPAPPQPASGDGLSADQPQPVSEDGLTFSTGQPTGLNRSMGPSQPVSGDGPSTTYPSTTGSSLSARVRELLSAVDPAVTERETDHILKTAASEARQPLAWLRTVIDRGDAAVHIEQARATLAYPAGDDGPHSQACRHGDHRDCRVSWCACPCGHPGQLGSFGRRQAETDAMFEEGFERAKAKDGVQPDPADADDPPPRGPVIPGEVVRDANGHLPALDPWTATGLPSPPPPQPASGLTRADAIAKVRADLGMPPPRSDAEGGDGR